MSLTYDNKVHLAISWDFRVTLSLIIGLMLVVATFAWLQTTNNPLAYFSERIPPGQTFYIFSKLFGLYSIVILGVQLSMGVAQIPAMSKYHRVLGVISLMAIIVHLSLFVTAVSLRSDYLNFSILIPDFIGNPFNRAVSFGVIAFFLLCFVALAGIFLHLTNKLLWLHRFSYVCFVFAMFHSVLIGTETRSFPMLFLYFSIFLLFLFALKTRLYQDKEFITS